MKMQNRLTLIVASMVLLITLFSVRAQDPSVLEVSDPQFTYDVNASLNSRGAYSGKSPIPATTVAASPVQEVSALFRNKGKKIIKSIAWEYVVFDDAKETNVRHVYRIRSDKTLLPGESVRLGKEGYHLHYSQYRKACVTRIEYKDGTIWQGAQTKG